jgi:hypothetical protein
MKAPGEVVVGSRLSGSEKAVSGLFSCSSDNRLFLGTVVQG